ncbi:MAG: hydrolase 1, exosortase A system-associated [Sphingopyxis sp.]|nr:hydrolase 1, exosortase A system-associated [Sphingopyxis sp.]
MRHQLSFECEDVTLAASLDEAPGSTGLLIVSGGNEIRSGAHRGMAMLAARIAEAGHPVFRFDRRGIGDSEGANGGFESSGPDIAAAIAAFRAAAPQITRIIAFGNCDAASALLLHQPLALDALIVANPWTYDGEPEEADEPALPPASAIRARYLARLKDPKSLLRLIRGEVDFRKLVRGLSALKVPAGSAAPDSLAAQVDRAIAGLDIPAKILLATGDRTAQAFIENCPSALKRVPVERLASPSHSFMGDDGAWLAERILDILGPITPRPDAHVRFGVDSGHSSSRT